MNRRGFVGLIGAAVASAAYDPERALYVPGKKLISIPKPATLRKRTVIHSEDGRWAVDIEYTTDPVIVVSLTGISIKAAEPFTAMFRTEII